MFSLILWILQIITALFLLIGLYIHIFITPLTNNVLYDLLFIMAAAYHGLNGLWSIIDESLRGKEWKAAEKFKTLITDFRYNKEAGHFIFILHRLTGIYLAFYLIQHIFTNAFISAYLSIDDFAVVEFLRKDLFDYLALLSLCFHAVNGIRVMFIELTGMTWLQRRLAYISLMLGTAFALYVVIMK
ncbi:MAG: hypothetical protein HY756_04295 [Nitrospirae bacterium]|nr:hypothetical protein [Nitrospirota bacterium]